MKLSIITARLNQLLADEHHSFKEIVLHLDFAVDAINSRLSTTFPAFSEIPTGADEYSCFPDKYIRTVVLPGAAWHYFTTDEEGISTAPQYQMEFEQGLFIMLRDYFNNIPAEYAVTDLKAVHVNSDMESGESGVSYNAWSILP